MTMTDPLRAQVSAVPRSCNASMLASAPHTRGANAAGGAALLDLLLYFAGKDE
jgi:hypothetical protein